MKPRDADLLLSTLGSAYGLAIQVVREVGDDGAEFCRVNAENATGHVLSIVHADLGGAALDWPSGSGST
jgi:hypothetical protein